MVRIVENRAQMRFVLPVPYLLLSTEVIFFNTVFYCRLKTGSPDLLYIADSVYSRNNTVYTSLTDVCTATATPVLSSIVQCYL